jgi:hypothetical protein
MTGGLKSKLQIAFLQKLGYFSGRAERAIEMNSAVNLPFGFLGDNFDKLFGVLMLHTAFDFLQSHLPQVFNRTGLRCESKDKRAGDTY